jgi:hypothetical protein
VWFGIEVKEYEREKEDELVMGLKGNSEDYYLKK